MFVNKGNIKDMSMLYPMEKNLSYNLLTFMSVESITLSEFYSLFRIEQGQFNVLIFIFPVFSPKINRSKMCLRIMYVLRANTKLAFY